MKKRSLQPPTFMPPKTATEKLAEAKAMWADMEHELQEAQSEADQEVEEVHKECK